MNILKNLYNYLQEVIIKWREESRIIENGRQLTSGNLKIILEKEKEDSFSWVARIVDKTSVDKKRTIDWSKLYSRVELIENNRNVVITIPDGVSKAINVAEKLAELYPQLKTPPYIVEVSPWDI